MSAQCAVKMRGWLEGVAAATVCGEARAWGEGNVELLEAVSPV